MPLIFANKVGTVSAVDMPGLPALLTVKGPGGNLTGQSTVVVTSIGVSQNVNIQFMPSLQSVLYIYSFGDRQGEIKVSGVAFDRNCDSEESNAGVNFALSYYDDNRAVTEGKIMTVIIGNKTLQGFLTGMNIQTADTVYRTHSFSYTIATVPETSQSSNPALSGPITVQGGYNGQVVAS